MRRVIVNADDLGHSAEVDDGIVEAHERGIVTSASLMVLRRHAAEAATYARRERRLSVGLHVDLGEWSYDNGDWEPVYETEAERIPEAVAEQLEGFRSLMGADPTHLDSHQHVHLREPARSVVSALGAELGIPVRHLTPHVDYRGDFYGQTESGEPLPGAITPESLAEVLRSLPDGTFELCCHPGRGAISGSSYAAERQRELEALCDPAVRTTIATADVELISFREVGAA